MSMFRFLFCVLFSFSTLIMSSSLMAQDLDETNFVRYTRLQGLSNNYISGIVQDSDGYIWVATHKGLNRFDGNNFLSIFKSSPHSPLPDNLLKYLHEQSPTEILGATRAGAFAYNPSTGGFKQFIVPCDSAIFFWTNNVFDLSKDNDGNYIVSTKTGLYVFNNSGTLIKRYDYHLPAVVGKVEMIFGGWVHTLPNGYSFQQNGIYGSMYDPKKNEIDTFYINKRQYLKKLMTDSSGDIRMSCSGKNGELFILNLERKPLISQICKLPKAYPARCLIPS